MFKAIDILTILADFNKALLSTIVARLIACLVVLLKSLTQDKTKNHHLVF